MECNNLLQCPEISFANGNFTASHHGWFRYWSGSLSWILATKENSEIRYYFSLIIFHSNFTKTINNLYIEGKIMGPMILFSGCRAADSDLHVKEKAAVVKEKILDREFLALSRSPPIPKVSRINRFSNNLKLIKY